MPYLRPFRKFQSLIAMSSKNHSAISRSTFDENITCDKNHVCQCTILKLAATDKKPTECDVQESQNNWQAFVNSCVA